MKVCVICNKSFNVKRTKTCSVECGVLNHKAVKKRYRESDPVGRANYNKEYRIKNRQRCAASSKRSRQKFMATVPQRPDKRLGLLIRTCRSSAKQKGIEFELTADVLMSMIVVQDQKCVLTGIPFSWDFGGTYRANPFAPSIDRKDSRKGYTYDNIQIVCYAVNLAKNEYPLDVFDKICSARMEKLKSWVN